jgi:hypothetical protein
VLQWGGAGKTSCLKNRVACHGAANFCTYKRLFVSGEYKQLGLDAVDRLTSMRLLASYCLLETTASGLAWSSAANTMHLPLQCIYRLVIDAPSLIRSENAFKLARVTVKRYYAAKV